MNCLYRNTRIVFVLLFFHFIGLPVIGQWYIGADVGYVKNYIRTDISNRNYTELVGGNGLNLKVTSLKLIRGHWALQSGVQVINKNYTVRRTAQYRGMYETTENKYLQIPVVGKYTVLEKSKFQFTVDIGIFAGYWLSRKRKGAVANLFDHVNDPLSVQFQNVALTKYSDKKTFDKSSDNRWDLGLQPGISVLYANSASCTTIISLTFQQSLLDQRKKCIVPINTRINQSWVASVGLLFTIARTSRS